jgi:hypothetical protein
MGSGGCLCCDSLEGSDFSFIGSGSSRTSSSQS